MEDWESIPPTMRMFLPSSMLSVDSLVAYQLPPLRENIQNLSDGVDTLSEALPMVDITHAPLIYTLYIPTANDLANLRKKVTSAALIGIQMQSLAYPLGPETTATIPIWTISYWAVVHAIMAEQEQWKSAISWMNKHDREPTISRDTLRRIPWQYFHPSTTGGGLSSELRLFCSTDWLSDSHMDKMLLVLQTKIVRKNIPAKALRSDYSNILISTFRHHQDTYLTCKSTNFIRTVAEDMKAGNVASIYFVIGVQHGTGVPTKLPTGDGEAICNHWVALVVDIKAKEFRYGDPLQNQPPIELCEVMAWWISTIWTDSNKEPWKWTTLLCAEQTDGYSCSILAINCLTHHYIPTTSILEPNRWHIARLDAMSEIVTYMEENVSHLA